MTSYRRGAGKRYWSARPALTGRVHPGHDADFWTRYRDMAGEVLALLKATSVELRDSRLCVLGCGDGATALGLANALQPALIVGFDTVAADREALLTRALAAGVATTLPTQLNFERLVPEGVPAEAATFDAVLLAGAWDEFRDFARPLSDVSRILRPDGVLVVVLSRQWPPRTRVPGQEAPAPPITLEDIQGALLAGAVLVDTVSLDAPLTSVSAEQNHMSLGGLAVRGIALTARPPRVAG